MSGPPPRDDAFDGRLEGAIVLIVTTRARPAEKRMERSHGTVEAAVRDKGVLLRLRGSRQGGTFRLPPGPGSRAPARPGRHRLRATGKVVVDPDCTTTWTIRSPKRLLSEGTAITICPSRNACAARRTRVS